MSDTGVGYKAAGSRGAADRQGQQSDENRDNDSSVATPEEYAVSTMIMALEKMAPKGEKLKGGPKSNALDGTPLRGNLSKDEDEAAEGQTENITILGRARSKRGGKTTSSRVPFPKRQTPNKSATVKGTAGVYRASPEHQKQVLSDSESSEVRAPIKSALKKQSRSETVPSAQRGPKQRHRQVRIHVDPPEDDLSVQSDPTNDSSYDDHRRHNAAGDVFLDHLIDLVGFDDYSMDDDTLLSKDASFSEHLEKNGASNAEGYTWSQCVSNDMEESMEGYAKMSSCNSMNVSSDIGKEVLSDISSAFSFNKDEHSKCKPMEAALGFNEEPRETEEETAYSSSCNVNGVFGIGKEEVKTPETPTSAPGETMPVQRVDSAQLTYVSELTSIAQQMPYDLSASMDKVKQSFEHESNKVFRAIQSPLSLSSQISGLVSPAPEEESRGDYEEELEILLGPERSSTPLPNPQTKTDTQKEDQETSSTGFQLPNSPFFYNPRSAVKSPVPFSSITGSSDVKEEKTSKSGSDDEVKFTEETTENVMPKIQDTFAKMNPDATEKGKKEKNCGAHRSLDEVMDTFQNVIACNRTAPTATEEHKLGGNFLSAISKSFSFWNADTKTNDGNEQTYQEEKKMEDQGDEWEIMDRNFANTSSPDEAKSNHDDEGSELSLEKDVTVSVHTVKLTFSTTEETSVSPARYTVERSKNGFSSSQQDAKFHRQEENDESCDGLDSAKKETGSKANSPDDDDFADFEEAGEKEIPVSSPQEDFADFKDVMCPSPSRQYKLPRRSSGRTVQTLTPPRIQKVSGVHTPENAAARLYRRLRKSPSRSFSGDSTGFLSVGPVDVLADVFDVEESKTSQGESADLQLDQSLTWQTSDDINTSTDSWQDFKDGDVFAGVWPTGSTQAQSETGLGDESFKVTYKLNSSKWLHRNKKQSKTFSSSKSESPQSVSEYGKSQPEFKSFGRRSLLKALSGTTQAEI